MLDGTVMCVAPGCPKKATVEGRCRKHYLANYSATSDGVVTGGHTPKLTAEQCVEVRRMSSKFATQQEIAKHFGVSLRIVREVLRREYVPRG